MLRLAVAALATLFALHAAAEEAQSTAPLQPPAAQPYAAPPAQGYAPAQPQAVQPQAVQPQAPPPAQGYAPQQQSSAPSSSAPLVVESEAGRPPLQTVVVGAAYGGVAGLLVGAGISLINEGDNLGRDLMIGVGAGLIVGAAVGGIQAYSESRRVAFDGLGSPERDRLAAAEPRTMMVAIPGRF